MDENWLGNGLLMTRVPRLFAMDSNKNFLASDRCVHGECVWNWNRPLHEGGVIASQFSNLFSCLTQVILTDRTDRRE